MKTSRLPQTDLIYDSTSAPCPLPHNAPVRAKHGVIIGCWLQSADHICYGGMIINGQVGSDGGFMLADITVSEINKLFD